VSRNAHRFASISLNHAARLSAADVSRGLTPFVSFNYDSGMAAIRITTTLTRCRARAIVAGPRAAS
jgi:hypothetical protein